MLSGKNAIGKNAIGKNARCYTIAYAMVRKYRHLLTFINCNDIHIK